MTRPAPCPIIERMCASAETSQLQEYTDDAPSLVHIVREETANGRLIVRFLVSAMQGELQGARPLDRLGAARILVSIGFEDTQEFIGTKSRAVQPRSSLQSEHGSGRASTCTDPELASIVRQETEGGRAPVRFLVDVMIGKLPDFKPHHRIRAARELLRRGFNEAADVGRPHDALPEPQPGPPSELKHEVPEGFMIAPEGDIIPNVFRRDHVINPNEMLFGHQGYRDWLRQKKEAGRTILKPGWWKEGIEDFVDEDALTLSEAIQEAAEAQGISISPHLLRPASPNAAPRPPADPMEETDTEPETDLAETVSEEQPWPEVVPGEDESTDVPWSKPGYFHRNQLSESELTVLDKGGVLHWDTVPHRFP